MCGSILISIISRCVSRLLQAPNILTNTHSPTMSQGSTTRASTTRVAWCVRRKDILRERSCRPVGSTTHRHILGSPIEMLPGNTVCSTAIGPTAGGTLPTVHCRLLGRQDEVSGGAVICWRVGCHAWLRADPAKQSTTTGSHRGVQQCNRASSCPESRQSADGPSDQTSLLLCCGRLGICGQEGGCG